MLIMATLPSTVMNRAHLTVVELALFE